MESSILTGPEAAPESGIVKRLVIFLHGVGADGNDLLALGEMMGLPDTQFISPNAPEPFDMAPFGHQWFSLIDRSLPAMLEGAKAAAPTLDAFILEQALRFNLAVKDIALVGFSQGTMMALFAGLRLSEPVAAIVGFSGALIGHDQLHEVQSRPPICLIHGQLDEVVPFLAMGISEKALHDAGVPVETHARPNLGHGIDERGLEIATEFLKKHFGL